MTEFKSPLDGAKFLLKTGRPIFPLGRMAKVPPKGSSKLKEQATTDRKQLNAWAREYPGCNWGYHPAAGGETVIDLDNHAGKNGLESLENWMKGKGYALPPTFTVRTPTGGKHLYFRGVLPGSKDGFLPGVDIHSTGKYVVAPGSVTNKGTYAVEDDREPADLPPWFADAFKTTAPGKSTTKDANPVSVHVTPDTDSNISLAIGIMENWSEAAEGERNNQLHQMMREVCKCGVSPAKAEELYYEHGADRLHYGLEESERNEVHNTILSAFGDMGDFGSNSFEARFSSFPASEDNEPDEWNDLASMSVPPRKWLIKDWLLAEPGTVHLFAGQGGTGKSLVSFMMAFSLATGEPWFEQEITHRAKSLIVTCEDSREEVARRVQRIAKLYDRKVIENSLIRIWCRQGKSNLIAAQGQGNTVAVAPFFTKLKETCARHFGKDGGVLFLDTVADFAAINENDRTQVSQFVKSILSDLAISAGISIVLLAHPNKSNREYSGSTAWEGSVRSRWDLKWRDERKVGGPLVLRLAKSNMVIAGKQILLQYENGLPRVVKGVERDTTVRDRMLELIREAEEADAPFGPSERSPKSILKATIKDGFGFEAKKDELNAALNELVSMNKVKIEERKRNKVLVVIK